MSEEIDIRGTAKNIPCLPVNKNKGAHSMSEDYKFGIEEEYFINDTVKRDIARGRIREFFQSCSKHLSEDIHPEMLEPQVEIASTPVTDFADARSQLVNLRSLVGSIAREHDLSIMAAG